MMKVILEFLLTYQSLDLVTFHGEIMQIFAQLVLNKDGFYKEKKNLNVKFSKKDIDSTELLNSKLLKII